MCVLQFISSILLIITIVKSPRQGGSNGGQIINLSILLIITIVKSPRQGGSNGGLILKMYHFIFK